MITSIEVEYKYTDADSEDHQWNASHYFYTDAETIESAMALDIRSALAEAIAPMGRTLCSYAISKVQKLTASFSFLPSGALQ